MLPSENSRSVGERILRDRIDGSDSKLGNRKSRRSLAGYRSSSLLRGDRCCISLAPNLL